jgi:hypothetical protein
MRFLSPVRALVTAFLVCALAPAPAFCAPNNRAIRDQLVALYPLTRVGMNGLAGFDYTRVTEPGPILAVRLPGIYADVANTKNAIIETNYTNGQITQATGFAAAFGGNTSHSRTLAPNEKVYVTQITVKRDAAMFELLTVDVTTLGDGRGTRYRAELNVKLPGLENMTPEDMKKTIDTIITDPATASAVESKTIKLGMSPDEVKKSLGNPDKMVDLGPKQVYIYKDMKVVFLDSQVSDVQ